MAALRTTDLPNDHPPLNAGDEVHINHVDQTESASTNLQLRSSYVADHGRPEIQPPSTDSVDGYRQLEGLDGTEPVCDSRNVDQTSSGCCEPSVDREESVRQSQYEDHYSTVCVDQIDLFHQSRNVDWVNPSQQSQSVDLTAEASADDQFRNVEEADCSSSTHPPHPLDSPDQDSSDQIRSQRSSTSVIQICSIIGLTFLSVAVVLYILRRARHSKA